MLCLVSQSVLCPEVSSIFFREDFADGSFLISCAVDDSRLNKAPLGCRTGGVHTNFKSRSSRVFLAVLKLGGGVGLV